MDADDDRPNVTPIPAWKRNLDKAHGKSKSPGLARETRRANVSVKEALLNAFDKLGNEAFFVKLGNGSAEDRRCLAMILAKLVPLELQGQLDHSLTVKIVKQVGEREVVVAMRGNGHNIGLTPQDAKTGERMPLVPATIDQAVVAAANEDDG